MKARSGALAAARQRGSGENSYQQHGINGESWQ